MNAEPKIAIRGLCKSFGPKVVLDGIDLDVGVAESVVIIGGSGTGKSVLLKCVLGLLEPDAGSITIDGQEVVGAPAEARERVNRKFGMLFQGAALFDSLRVWENIAFGLISAQRMAKNQAREIAIGEDALRQVGAAAANDGTKARHSSKTPQASAATAGCARSSVSRILSSSSCLAIS